MAPIIFVWLGKSLPLFSVQFLLFTKESNPSRQVFCCLDNEPSATTREILEQVGLKIFLLGKIENIGVSGLDPKKLQYGGDFWVNTSLRFFYLEYLCGLLSVDKFFHAELDNAVFNLNGLDEKLDQCGNGLFVPRDASDRAVASLIYCNRPESLSELTEIYSSSKPPRHDMDALGLYARTYPDHFFSLPTESYVENIKRWKIIDPNFCGGIFDAAAIGQYALGVDPIHRRFRPSYNMCINENSRLDWKRSKLVEDNGKLFIENDEYQPNGRFPLYNLHIHSKNWSAFENLLYGGSVLKRLQKNKKSIISGFQYLFFGGALSSIVKLKQIAARLFKYAKSQKKSC